MAVETNLLPWTEKYRPKKLSDVSSQKETISVLKKIVQTKNLPHLLFYGPAGTGKTSTILAMAKELFHPFTKDHVLELNASDERGINVIRSKIKRFAGLATPKHKSSIPEYRIIILDEADWMTSDAQNALRRIMESRSDVTRFCLICNYVSRIIAPIASRCSKFRFKPLDSNSVVERLRHVANSENIEIADEVLRTIEEITEGDLRKGITLLQCSNNVYADKNSPNLVKNLSTFVPENEMAKIFKKLKTENYEEVKKMAKETTLAAYSAKEVTKSLCKLVSTSNLNEIQKAKICLKLAETEFNLSEGADQFLQILDSFGYVNSVIINTDQN